MPRYFFSFVWANEAVRDTEGAELEGLPAAYLRALEMLHRIRVNFPDPGHDWVIEISDDAGRKPLVILPFSVADFRGRRPGCTNRRSAG
jgi:hypothetical protein